MKPIHYEPEGWRAALVILVFLAIVGSVPLALYLLVTHA